MKALAKLVAATCLTYAAVLGLLVSSGGTASRVLPGVTPNVILFQMDGHRISKTNELLYWAGGDATPCPSSKSPARMPEWCPTLSTWTCLPTRCTHFESLNATVGPGKTMTKPQTAQMLTGQPPEVTGVIRNNGGGGRIPSGMSIFAQLRAAFGDEINLAISGSSRFLLRPLKQDRRDGVLDREDMLRRKNDRRPLYSGNNSLAAAVALIDKFKVDEKPFFFVIHMKNADWAAHKTGGGNVAYDEAIVLGWEHVGKTLDALSAAGLAENTLVFTSADHGFNPTGAQHQLRDGAEITDIPISASGIGLNPAAVNPTILDVTPTILAAMGVDLSLLDPSLPGQSLLAP